MIYDVVIIGSGLGGLICGNILSKEGKNVCILEKNRQLGGSLQIFSREKVIFDTGIHYIGGLNEGQNLYQYFKYLGMMDKLKMQKLDEDGFDHISFPDGKIYKHAQGYNNFIETLCADFPEERQALNTYCNKIKEICDFFPLYKVQTGNKDLMQTDLLSINARDYIASVTSNARLQNILGGSNALYAGVAEKTPLYVHALVVNTYIESSWKCFDGGAQMATILSKSIKENGGTILNYSEADKFNFDTDKIKSVQLTDGRQIEGKHFISNFDISKTLEMIEPGKVRQAYRSRINSLENSMSAIIVNVVLKKNSLKYFNHNLYHFNQEDVWCGIDYKQELWPEGIAVFPTLASKNPEYTDGLTILAYMDYKEVEKWAHTKSIIPNHKEERGADYEEFKNRKAEKIIDRLEERLPGIRQKIQSYYVSTPLTYRDYIGSRDGTLYGILKDYKDPLKTFITPKTKVPNLYLTGQNLNLHGVLGVTVGAIVTCSEFFGTDYLVKNIKAVQ